MPWNANASATATCGYCHLDSPTTNRHQAHIIAGSTDHTDCDQCHPSSAYVVAASGTDATFLSGTHATTPLVINLVAGLGASGSGGTLTCTTNACHRRDTATTNWGTAATLTCNSCHYTPSPATGVPTQAGNLGTAKLGDTHDAHFFGAPTNILCAECHVNPTADTTAPRTHMLATGASDGAILVNKAQAVMDEATVTPTALGGGSDSDAGFATCNISLCHNPTPGAAFIATWGGTNNLCNFCHADAAGVPASGSHAAHINYAAGYAPCTACHPNNGATQTHMNRSVDMAVVAYNGLLTPPYDSSSWGACTAACHAVAAGNPTWGQAQGTDITDCAVCHTDATNDTNNYAGSDGTASEVMTGLQWTALGHGAKAGANTCASCHTFSGTSHDPTLSASGNPFRLGMSYTGSDAFCSNTTTCHTGAQSSIVVSHTAALMTADQRTWPSWVPKCVDCHDPHGDGANLAMIQSDLFDRGSSTHGIPTATLNSIPRTTDTTVFTTKADITAGSYANSTDADGICQECHLANDGLATGTLSFLDDNTTPIAPTGNHPNSGLSPCTSCHTHNKAFEPSACESCHDKTPYVKGAATAPNVMGDGDLLTGDTLHTTPRPYDDGTYGYNVSGHGRDDSTSAISKGDPIAVECDSCHDVSQPPGTHPDGILNGRLTGPQGDTRNANSFHLKPGFINTSPLNDWAVQTTFDNYCWSAAGCHSGKTTNMRHPLDGGNDSSVPAPVPPYYVVTDPFATQFGTHSSYDAPIVTLPKEMFYDRNIVNAATLGSYDGIPNFALCVSCHNPHGTKIVNPLGGTDTSPRTDGNNKMMIYWWNNPGQLCVRCH